MPVFSFNVFFGGDLGFTSFSNTFTYNSGTAPASELVINDPDDNVLEDGGIGPGETFDGQELLVSIGGDTSSAGLDVSSTDVIDVVGSDGSSFRGYIIAFGDGTLDIGGRASSFLNLDGSTITGNLFSQVYWAFEQPLVEGVTYTTSRAPGFSVGNVNFVDLVCFAAGTRIETDKGALNVETLKVGDLVATHDHGLQPIRWIGSRRLSESELAAYPKLRPIRISAGTLGQDTPVRDLVVSRQHRLLLRSKIAERMFGESEVLVSAVRLTELPGIFVDESASSIEYFHILFDQHQVIYAEGAPAESLYTGPQALSSLSVEAREEILTLFPELENLEFRTETARLIPAGKKQRQLISRHLKNNRYCLSQAGTVR